MEVKSIHFNLDNISRSNNAYDREHSAVAAAAYQSRERIRDNRSGRVHRYTRKDSDLLYKGLLAPVSAPAWAHDRAQLWNAVEARENRKDARVAKAIRAAIIREVPRDQWVMFVEEFFAPYVVWGLAVDYAVHMDAGENNPHIHVLITTRTLDENGFAKTKFGKLNEKTFLKDERQRWAELCNKYLAASGAGVCVTHESFKTRGLDQQPTQHRGKHGHEQFDIHWEADTMYREPTIEERLDYPNLTEYLGNEWPPSPDMETADLTVYEKRDFENYLRTVRLEREGVLEAHRDQTKADQTREDAKTLQHASEGSFQRQDSDASRFAHDLTYGTPDSYYTETRLRESEWTQDVVKRALTMNRSKREHEYLRYIQGEAEAYAKKHDVPSYFLDDVRRMAEDRVIERRVVRLLEEDRKQRERTFNDMLDRADSRREKEDLRAMLKTPDEFEQEQELPVPDHEGNPIHPRELDEAQQRMTDEMDVEQHDRDAEDTRQAYEQMKADRTASREQDFEEERAEAKAVRYEPILEKNTNEELEKRGVQADELERQMEAEIKNELHNDQREPAYITFEKIDRLEALVDKASDAQERARLQRELEDMRAKAFEQDADDSWRNAQIAPSWEIRQSERERDQEHDR